MAPGVAYLALSAGARSTSFQVQGDDLARFCARATPGPSRTASPTPTPPPLGSTACATLYRPGEIPGAVHELGPERAPGAISGSGCVFGALTGSGEVAAVSVTVYPSADVAQQHFPGLGTPLAGVGDQATLFGGGSSCEMPTDDENVKVPGACGAMRKGAVIVYIVARAGSVNVPGLLRAAADRV